MSKLMKNKVLALLLAFVMIIGMLPASALATETASDDEFKVVISMEGLTLGQGFYVEPTAYTLDEINELLVSEGYDWYEEDQMTVAAVTLAMLIDNGLEWQMTGSWEDSGYLSAVKGIDKGVLDIPSIITECGGPSNTSNDGNDDEWLGEFDYSMMSGWMYSINDYIADVGMSACNLKDYVEDNPQFVENYGNTYVIRWQFTLWDYGADLGFPESWSGAYYDGANKDLLYIAYAESTNEEAKAAALSVMTDLQATEEEVAEALALLEAAAESDTPAKDEAQDVSALLNDALAQLAATVTAPVFGSTGGEWSVLCLARGNYYAADSDYFATYYEGIVDYVNETAASVSLANGALHKNKSTDNSRLILALSSIGKDATSVGDWNLITPYEDFSWITKQGINGPIFALIALDTNDYQTEDTTIRQQCVDYILSKQLTDGGWALSGSTSDPDITAMALQALYNYKDQSAVATAAEEAFAWLSSAQLEDGGYASWGTVNSESVAQVITACATWGINPDTDSAFIKNGNSLIDNLLTFYDETEKAFEHTAGGGANAMATDQACYALIAYDRLLNGENALYDMSDVTFEATTPDTSADPEATEISAILSIPAEVEAGQSFNAIVSVDAWDSEAGYKLIDFVMDIPEGITVTGVTASSRLSGGEVSYNVDSEGKLRVVYFDANGNSTLTVSGSDYPAELFIISFECTAEAGESLKLAISEMSLKLSSDSSDAAAIIIVNTDNASGTIEVVATEEISYFAVELYTGDDVDLIPSTKKAVAVYVTGVADQAKLSYSDGTNAIEFLYSSEISEKLGISTYVALVDASISMTSFNNAEYYTIGESASTIAFGDSNSDGVVNAQDALAAVNAWLRKTDVDDMDILTLNVNGDSRLNTFDALGIVEAFVNSTDYAVVTKAASLAIC